MGAEREVPRGPLVGRYTCTAGAEAIFSCALCVSCRLRLSRCTRTLVKVAGFSSKSMTAKKCSSLCSSGTLFQDFATAFHAGSNSLRHAINSPQSPSPRVPYAPARPAPPALVHCSKQHRRGPVALRRREQVVRLVIEADDAVARVGERFQLLVGAENGLRCEREGRAACEFAGQVGEGREQPLERRFVPTLTYCTP